MERTILLEDLIQFVDRAQQLDTSTNPLQVCIQELKGILLKHLAETDAAGDCE